MVSFKLYWQRLTQVSTLADTVDTVFVGVGSLFFCASPLSGLLFTAATFALSVRTGTDMLLGTLAATVTAMAWYLPKELIKIGFYSFNGALIGIYWSFLTPATGFTVDGLTAWGLMLLAAALTVPVAKVLFHLLSESKYNLPILSWPSLLVAWLFFWAMPQLRLAYPVKAIIPADFDSRFTLSWSNALSLQYLDYSTLLAGYADLWLPVGLLLLGYAVYSRWMLLTTASGMVLGATIAFLIGGWSGLTWVTLIAMTIIPTTTALGGFFVAPTLAVAGLVLVADLLAALVWISLTLLLTTRGLPVFTAAFATTTTLTLLLLRLWQDRNLRKGPSSKPSPLLPMPLVQIGTVETNRAWYAKLDMAEHYWQQVSVSFNDHAPVLYATRRDHDEAFTRAAELLLEANKVTVFTGAGISTESHIPDYRTDFLQWRKYDTSHFLWENFLASEYSRMKYWEMSQDFYLLIKQAQPNPAHLALAELEEMGKLHAIITQNVDRLHQRAGTTATRVIEIHGNELNCTCLQCGAVYSRGEIFQWILNGVKVPYCYRCSGGIIKPNSVAFNQPMPIRESNLSLKAAEQCDVFLIVGSSLAVQPASLLPWKAKERGAKLVLINLTGTHVDEHADLIIRERAGVALPAILDRLRQMQLYFT